MWGETKVNAKTREAEVKTGGAFPDNLTIFIHSFNQQTFNKGIRAQSLFGTGNTTVDKTERASVLIDFPPLVECDRQLRRQINKSVSGSEKC